MVRLEKNWREASLKYSFCSPGTSWSYDSKVLLGLESKMREWCGVTEKVESIALRKDSDAENDEGMGV